MSAPQTGRQPDGQLISPLRRAHSLVPAGRKGVPAVVVLALLLALLSLAGCNESRHAADADDLDAGAGFELEAGAAVADGFLAEDLPLSPGSVYRYAAAGPESPSSVAFDLEGPWDFRDGPDAATLTIEYSEAAASRAAESFPAAATAATYTWDPELESPETIFMTLSEDSLTVYGRSRDAAELLVLAGSSRSLLFPIGVGDSWTDSYVEVTDTARREVTAENTVLARNELRVPAGDYDAYLLQTSITSISDSGRGTRYIYSWLVPGVGKAAELVSLPDESKPVFGQASAFFRLIEIDEA